MNYQSEFSVNIGVLHYKTLEKTINCVNSIQCTTDGANIYIIDNYSNDGTLEQLKETYKGVSNIHFICLEENKGFAKANNHCMRLLKEKGEKNVILTNNDIVFLKQAIQTMIKELNDTQAILIAPKVVNPDGVIQDSVQEYCDTNIWEFFFRKLKKHFHTPKTILAEKCTTITPIKSFSGCCFACDLEKMKHIGYFDENTFLYFEEPILSVKIHRAGYELFFVPSAQVMHHHGATTSSLSRMAIGYELESQTYFMKEYLGANKYFLRLYVKYKRFRDKRKYKSKELYNKESSIITKLLK